jgi:hypothetical protein
MRLFTLLLSTFLTFPVLASQQAITDTGKKVILQDDGTWVYANGESPQLNPKDIPTIAEPFTRSDKANFQVKSTKNNTAYWIDTSSWAFEKGQDHKAAEYQFRLKGKDLYGMAISEGFSVPLLQLANIALENARKVAPDAIVSRQEYRTVNGLKVLYMEMKGTTQGIKFTYMGYYYSNDKGSTQLVTYTATNLADQFRPAATEFLNGLVTQ